MPLSLELQEVKSDPLVDFLTKGFDELRFEIQPDGTFWCSDSNATVDPHEWPKEIRKIVGCGDVR